MAYCCNIVDYISDKCLAIVNPNLIIPVGTQVVSRIEVKNKQIVLYCNTYFIIILVHQEMNFLAKI